MDTNDLTAFKSLFIKTARGHIVRMQHALEVLSSNMTDAEAIKDVFVGAHSLKGEAFALGHLSTGNLSHMLEKIFYSSKEGKIVLSEELLTLTKSAVVKLDESLTCIEKEDKELVSTDLLMSLEKASGITVTS